MYVMHRITTYMWSLCNIFLHLSAAITPFVALSADQWCVRCLLITESPKTPGHYRYQIWVLVISSSMGMPIYCFLKTFELCYLDSVAPARWYFLPPVYTCLKGVALVQHSEATLTHSVIHMFECVCVRGEWDHYSLFQGQTPCPCLHTAVWLPTPVSAYCGPLESPYIFIYRIYRNAVSVDEARDGSQKNTQGVWPCKLPIDSLPLQQLASSPALMSCLSKQPRRWFLTAVADTVQKKRHT